MKQNSNKLSSAQQFHQKGKRKKVENNNEQPQQDNRNISQNQIELSKTQNQVKEQQIQPDESEEITMEEIFHKGKLNRRVSKYNVMPQRMSLLNVIGNRDTTSNQNSIGIYDQENSKDNQEILSKSSGQNQKSQVASSSSLRSHQKSKSFQLPSTYSRDNALIIDSLFSKQRQQQTENLQIMDHLFRSKPQEFQTVFKKNLQVFAIEEKQHQSHQLSSMYAKQKLLMDSSQAEHEKLQKLLIDYKIQMKQNAKLPYDYRMQKNCLAKNYFYKYKKERVEILSDKPTLKQLEEPFHVKYRREQREKEEKQRLLEAKKLAMIMGNYQEAQEIQVQDEEVKDPEDYSKHERLSMWVQRNQILKREQLQNEKINFENSSVDRDTNRDEISSSPSKSLFNTGRNGGILKNSLNQVSSFGNLHQNKGVETTKAYTSIMNETYMTKQSIEIHSFDNRRASHGKHSSVSGVIPQDDKTFISLMRTERTDINSKNHQNRDKLIQTAGFNTKRPSMEKPQLSKFSQVGKIIDQDQISKIRSGEVDVGDFQKISKQRQQEKLKPILKFNKSMNLAISKKNQQEIQQERLSLTHSLNSSYLRTPNNILNLMGLSSSQLSATRVFSKHSRSKSDSIPQILKTQNLLQKAFDQTNKVENQQQQRKIVYKSFKEKTPSINDNDIKILIQKYPSPVRKSANESELQNKYVSIKEYLQQNQSGRQISQIKGDIIGEKSYIEASFESKKLNQIMRLCQNIEKDYKSERNETEYKQLVQQIKNQEFEQTLSHLRELEQAHPDIIPFLYQYKVNDINDNIILAQEVAKEYQSGKADPKMVMMNEKNTKSLIKKGVMLR